MIENIVNLVGERGHRYAEQYRSLQAQFFLDYFAYKKGREAATTEELAQYLSELRKFEDLSRDSLLFKGWLIRYRVDQDRKQGS